MCGVGRHKIRRLVSPLIACRQRLVLLHGATLLIKDHCIRERGLIEIYSL